jgi:SagB-type dehydrogenase family enzyme
VSAQQNGGPPLQTIQWAAWIYGEDGPDPYDPAEVFHEASKLYPSVVDARIRGGTLLEHSAELRASAVRAVKRHSNAPVVELPRPQLPDVSLAEVLRRRSSGRSFGPAPIDLEQLSTILMCGYGVTHALDGYAQPLRAVPSGGALYPLELYVAANGVEGLTNGLYHFDPLRAVLEQLRSDTSREELRALGPYPELLEPAAVVIFVTAMFWRSRFKYGLRGYRFVLLEAGHLGQNVLLAATALGLASLPVGGVFDRRADDYLGVDGVNESLVYTVAIGPEPSE